MSRSVREAKSRSGSQLSILERAAIEELDATSSHLSRLERLLIAAIVELGQQGTQQGTNEAPSEGDLPAVERLTVRENAVLRLVVDGHTSRSAGAALGISERTVEVHRLRIMKKFGVRSSAELVRAITEGAAGTADGPGRAGARPGSRGVRAEGLR